MTFAATRHIPWALKASKNTKNAFATWSRRKHTQNKFLVMALHQVSSLDTF